MVQRFGKWVQPHLAKLWELAKQGAEAVAKYLQNNVPAKDWRSSVPSEIKPENGNPPSHNENSELATPPQETTVRALHGFYLQDHEARKRAKRNLRHRSYLSGAAGSVAPTGTDDTGGSKEAAGKTDSQQREDLLEFARSQALMFDADALGDWMVAHYVRGGSEHKLGLDPESGRVVKAVGVLQIATDSLYAYLTDHQLTGLLFGDDVTLEGFVEAGSGRWPHQKTGDFAQLHIVISQSWVAGEHPSESELISWGQGRNLDFTQGRTSPSMRVPGAGEIELWDVKPDNAIQISPGNIHPVDFHFFFADDVERQRAIEAIEHALSQGTGPPSVNTLEDTE